MPILQDFNQKHQSNNCSSAPENLNDQPTTAKSSNSAEKSANRLNHQDFEHCCQKRGLNADWIIASCSSVSIKEASELLGYTAKSPGILIQGANGQYQFRPNKPWSSKQGKKAPKYRTAAGDEYDALLPQHPTDKFYWNNIEKLKQDCYQIDGHPMLLVTEGGFKAISTCSHNLPTLALLGVEMGLTSSKDDPQGKRYLVPELERLAKLGFGFILAFDCDTYSKKPVLQALIKLATQLLKFEVPVYTLPKWDESEGKGIDDYIQKNSIEEFRNKLLSQTISFEDWYQEYGQEAREQKLLKLDTGKLISYIRTKYRERLRLNKLQQKIELDGVEFLLEEAYLLLAEEDGVDCSKTKAADIFTKIATENTYSPVLNYLNTVAEKVAPVNLDNLSQRYFGTTNSIYDVFLKRTLIAAVARAYQPGCKHDTTLVLQGLQGAGKSTFFDVLGGDWFDDSMGDGHNKDDLIILHKSWIQEWGEIERTFSKRKSEELKAFITRRKDLFRPPYGRSALEFPRQSIIVGTANSTEFLVDCTGSRRYWIIPLATNKIKINQLKEERDRIWAAAVKAYRNGEQWWLTEDEEKSSNQNNQQFEIVDEWQGAIADYLEYREKVSVTEILQQVFDFEAGKIDRRTQMRVANILTSLQWKKVGQQKHLGKRQVIWQSTIPQKGGIAEVLHSETQSQQGISTPTIPTIPMTETSHEEKDSLQLQQSYRKLEEKVQSGIEVLPAPSQQGIQAATPTATPTAIPQSREINWEDYPYNSKDRYTLKNRANKVKERILNSATNNELIKLHATGEVSEPEITWIKANLLTDSELQQLELIEATTQNSLFDAENNQESESSAIEVGDLVTVQSNQLEALVIDRHSQSGLYEITYLESEKTVWEGLANLTKL